MDHAERGITVANRVGNDAHGQQIVNLVEGAVLAQALLVNGIEPLDAAFHFGGNPVFLQSLANRVLHFRQKCLEFLCAWDDRFLQFAG